MLSPELQFLSAITDKEELVQIFFRYELMSLLFYNS
jgi:hypothetical protein